MFNIRGSCDEKQVIMYELQCDIKKIIIHDFRYKIFCLLATNIVFVNMSSMYLSVTGIVEIKTRLE